jgi:hypothetical protein
MTDDTNPGLLVLNGNRTEGLAITVFECRRTWITWQMAAQGAT